MTVTKPRLSDMPRETEELDIPIMQLEDDLLGSVFDRRLAERDPWLVDVVASGWNEAPELPTDEIAQFVTEQNETTYGDLEDLDRDTTREFEELSDSRKTVWKTAEDTFGQGTQADPFVKGDLVDRISGGNSNTIGKYIRELAKDTGLNTEEPNPFRYTGEKGKHGAKKYVVEDSYEVTISADGGQRWVHPWDETIEQLEKRDLITAEGSQPRDWFAQENWSEWMDFVAKTHSISNLLEEVAYVYRRHLAKPSARRQTRIRQLKRLREDLIDLKGIFKEAFYLLKNLAQTFYKSVIMWGSNNDTKPNNIQPESARPSVKLEKIQKKLDAKQYAIIDTYLNPLIAVIPSRNAGIESVHDHGDRVYEMIQSVGAWLTWVDSCCTDILDYGRRVVTENTLTADARAFYQVLDNEWDGDPPTPSADEFTHASGIPWTELVERSADVRGGEWAEHTAITALEDLARAGSDDETDWQGLLVWDASDGPINFQGKCEPHVALVRDKPQRTNEWWDNDELTVEMTAAI